MVILPRKNSPVSQPRGCSTLQLSAVLPTSGTFLWQQTEITAEYQLGAVKCPGNCKVSRCSMMALMRPPKQGIFVTPTFWEVQGWGTSSNKMFFFNCNWLCIKSLSVSDFAKIPLGRRADLPVTMLTCRGTTDFCNNTVHLLQWSLSSLRDFPPNLVFGRLCWFS